MKESSVLNARLEKSTVKKLQNELAVARKLNNIKLYQIAMCLLLWGQEEYSCRCIAAKLEISVSTVTNWINCFCERQFEWMIHYHYRCSRSLPRGKVRSASEHKGSRGRGRPPKLNEKQRGKLYKVICNGPQEYGFDCGGWNSVLIREVILAEFGKEYSVKYVPQLLKSMKLSFQKAKFVAEKAVDDEELIRKRREWDEIIWPGIVAKAKRENAVILFGDEVGFAQWGSLSYTWAPEGKQPLVKTCGKRGQMKVFGAIGFQNGRLHYQECEGKLTNQTYEKFLRYLLMCYKGRKIILIEDGAPYHNGRNLAAFKAANEDRIQIERLPSYSPDKNPIERLWKNVKRDGTHLKYFPTMDCLRDTVIYTFEKYRRNSNLVFSVMRKLTEEWGLKGAA